MFRESSPKSTLFYVGKILTANWLTTGVNLLIFTPDASAEALPRSACREQIQNLAQTLADVLEFRAGLRWKRNGLSDLVSARRC